MRFGAVAVLRLFVVRIAVTSTVTFAVTLGMPFAHAAPFECAQACAALHEEAYPHLVVGIVDGVAGQQQSTALFQAMRKANRWSALPADPEAFRLAVQPVSIRLPSGRSYTVLITQKEAQAAPLRLGDFVRYAPHRGVNEQPPTQADALAYWLTTGCVAVLCRAGDEKCAGGYRAGIYRTADGAALTPDGGKVDPGGARIDPNTVRPR